MALKINWSVKTPWYWSTGIEVARSCFYSFLALLSIFKTFVSFPRGIFPVILACIVSFAVFFVFSSHPAWRFQCSWRLENECWDSCGLKGNGSERVDRHLRGPKGTAVSTAFKNGGRCRAMKLEPPRCSPPISSYMASQSLTTFKNNYLMRWVNVRLFLSTPSIKQPLCNSFYSLRTLLCIHHIHAMLDHKSTSVVYYNWLRLPLQQTITVGAIQ